MDCHVASSRGEKRTLYFRHHFHMHLELRSPENVEEAESPLCFPLFGRFVPVSHAGPQSIAVMAIGKADSA